MWFAFLPTDRLARARPEVTTSPWVLLDKDRGALRLSAVNAEALALGLSPGLTWADAQAQVPHATGEPHDPAGDAALLERLLSAFGRFSPMVALDLPHGLVLDVTGCAHLFGGEMGLLQAVQRLCERLGLQVRLAIARTPQAARAQARFGPGGIIAPGQDRSRIRALPIAALELSERDATALKRAGLYTLADVDERPRAALAARFGKGFPARLDRLLGCEDARISPFRPAAPVRADRILAEPVQDDEPLHQVIADLLADVEHQLETRRQGGRHFLLSLFRVDGHVRRIGVGTARPERQPERIHRLFRERLGVLDNPVDPGFGFDHLRLEVEQLEALLPDQTRLDAAPDREAQMSSLIDRLSARLGPQAVLRVHPVASHLPERACRLRSAGLQEPEPPAWPGVDPHSPPLRPLQLFDPPQPIETLAELPDSPPRRFRWRRVMHEVVSAEGPERIESEWWHRPDGGRGRVRDYYRVEDAEGRRFWLFRAGHYGDEPGPRWYVHGLFA